MSISRRSFLHLSGPLSVAPFLPRECDALEPDPPGAHQPFRHGVASGDPTARSVVLWTRVTPEAGSRKVDVRWMVAKDPELADVAASGSVTTDGNVDFTVKIDAQGLKPGTAYYYVFGALGRRSPIGRTKTLPVGRVARLRFALASCSNHPFGFFNAYRLMARRADLDAILHLGDYLYEYQNGVFGDGTGIGRIPEPNREIITLQDYRARHAQYKTDPDLQEAHRQHPFIAVWDDHESANNAFRDGAENHQPETEGAWELRKAAAIRAYFEWMPIRGIRHDGTGRIYRSFRFGDLADLILLDTRLAGRDEQVADACDGAALASPDRSLLGGAQESWFFGELESSKRRNVPWRLVGQQVMFGQLLNLLEPGRCVLNTDQWDGYGASRARVLETLRSRGIDNVVVLTGDIHSSWGIDLTENPFDPLLFEGATGRGSAAVEIVAPAVTSPGIDDPAQAALLGGLLRQTHPHIRYVELNRRGYALLDVTRERVQAEWYHVDTVAEPGGEESLAFALATRSGQNHLEPALAPTVPRSDAPAPAPSAEETA